MDVKYSKLDIGCQDKNERKNDIISDGNVAITIPKAYTHPNSGVTAGTYNNVTVNAQGHVTAGSNVTEGVPTGTILPYCGTSAPSGFLICNGGAISRTSYSALFQMIGTKYGSGNGSTTFNLPNMHHRFLEGTTSTSEVNTYVSAGLPNITGSLYSTTTNTRDIPFGDMSTSDIVAYGSFSAISKIYRQNCAVGSGSDDHYNGFSFKASWSSTLYGSSTTVQPNSMRILFLIKY